MNRITKKMARPFAGKRADELMIPRYGDRNGSWPFTQEDLRFPDGRIETILRDSRNGIRVRLDDLIGGVACGRGQSVLEREFGIFDDYSDLALVAMAKDPLRRVPTDNPAVFRFERIASNKEKQQEEQQTPPRKLRGTSILDYAEREIDHSKNLLGTRWLSRQCGAFVVAPSGHGKSSFVVQVAICWACGRRAFAIQPARPLRILIVQAEDDDNDIIEMAQMIHRLNLSEQEQTLVRANTHVEWLNNVTGDRFFEVLAQFLEQFPADLVIINPYTAYQGGELKDDKLNNYFLRVQLTEIMNRFNCGALPIHHTPKTNFQNVDKYAWFDWMYSMAGGAALTNWARGILVIAPSDTPGTYRFIAAKRFEKIGWQDREYWFAQSIENDKILWVPASQEQIACGRKGKNAGPDDLLGLIPELDPIRLEKLIVTAKQKLGFGEKKVRTYLKVLVEDEKAFRHVFPRSRTNSEVRYAKTKQTDYEN
jgi:AAA domain